MNSRGFIGLCLTMLVFSLASANSDASLYASNSDYSIDHFVGGASLIDPCTLYISPFKIKGNVKPIYIPAGSQMDITSAYKSSESQLDFTLTRHGSSSDTWSMTISLPNCSPQQQTQNNNRPLVSKIGIWCHRCSSLENSMLATGTISTTATSTTSTSTEGGATVVLVINDANPRLPSRRSLLQATANCATYPCSGCSGPLTVGSASNTFDSCVSLAPELQLFYTLVPSGSGTTFKGGLWAKNSQFYSAFGFSPDGTGSMIGGDAVIVYPDTASSTGASVTGITMTTYNVAALEAAKGSYPIADTSAAKNPDGSLSATFSVQLASSIDKLKADQLVFIYVQNGPMLPGNVLGDHTRNSRGALFGANVLTVETTSSPAAAGSTKPASQTTPTPTPTVLPVTAPTTDGDDDGDREVEAYEKVSDGDGGETITGVDSVIPPATTPTTTPSSTPSSSTPSSSCSVTLAGQEKTYEACYSTKVGSEFSVFYRFEPDPLDPKSSLLSMAMKSKATGYVGVGFPSRPGSMTNAGAAILQVCSTCSSGASIKEYYMTGTSVSDVFPDNRMNMSDFIASVANGVMTGAWKMKLPGTPATARRRLLVTSNTPYPATAFPLIYAAGPVSSSGGLLAHSSSNEASGNLDLLNGLAGAGGGGEISTDISQSNTVENAHMWIATISWGVLIPLAILMARYFKPHTGKWFMIHRAVAITGFILAIVALILGFDANNGWETDQPVHRNLGMACTVLGLVQMVAVINKLRPAPDHKYRKYWFFGHAWIGRTAVILAIANIYYGIINVAELGTWAWAVYTAVLACIVGLGLVMEVINWRLKKISVASETNMAQKISAVGGGAGAGGVGSEGYYSNGVSASTSRQDSRQMAEVEII